jgi:hypothetical protein
MNMQAGYDLKIEAKAKRLAISKIVPSISADGEVRKAA